MMKHALIPAALLVAMAVAPAQAASVSYFLDQSNALPDGTNYLQVTIADGAEGAIDFTVEALSPLSDIAGSNFGIQNFGFNLGDFGLDADNIENLADGWSIANGQGQMSGFGRFDVVLAGTGNSRQVPLTFSIVGIADSIFDYVALSGSPASEGHSFFAAHVAGFDWDENTTSAFFGGVTPVPAPAAVWLMLSGIGLLATKRLRRRN